MKYNSAIKTVTPKKRLVVIEIIAYIFCLISVIGCLIALGKPLLMIKLFTLTFYTVGYSSISLLFVMCWIRLFIELVFYFKYKNIQYSTRFHLCVILVFIGIVIINVFPIVFWIKCKPSIMLLPFYLILSNMLLYYFTLHTYREMLEEEKELYVASSFFKGTSPIDYLKEKRQWVMRNNIRPMFYHLFSFTLFTDIMVLPPEYNGIVGYIFGELKNSQEMISQEVLLSLVVTAVILYPLKRLLELPEKVFARKHHIHS